MSGEESSVEMLIYIDNIFGSCLKRVNCFSEVKKKLQETWQISVAILKVKSSLALKLMHFVQDLCLSNTPLPL